MKKALIILFVVAAIGLVLPGCSCPDSPGQVTASSENASDPFAEFPYPD